MDELGLVFKSLLKKILAEKSRRYKQGKNSKQGPTAAFFVATSWLLPLDAGIIRVFKCKYMKRLLKYVVSRNEKGTNASEIIQDVNVAKALHWSQVARRDVSTETLINCSQKCGFGQGFVNSITNDNVIDEEIKSLLTQLCEDDEITVEDFVIFDNLTTSIDQINTELIHWWQHSQEEAIKEVVSVPARL